MIPNERFTRSILIPTDFSRVCENAIDHGYELAKRLNYSIHFLHVASKENRHEGSSGLINPATENFRKMYIMNDPVKTRLLIRYGNLFSEINRSAGKLHPNLLILGTHGKKGIQRLYGSYALRVVLDAPCAVIVVHTKPFSQGYRNILVPLHGELDAGQTATWLITMNSLFPVNVLILRMKETDEDLNKKLLAVQTEITGRISENKVVFRVSEADEQEDFSTQVLRMADACHSDLIMTIPGSGDHRFSLSKWNERLMFNDSEIPVMILNPLDYSEEWRGWMKEQMSIYSPAAPSSLSLSQ